MLYLQTLHVGVVKISYKSPPPFVPVNSVVPRITKRIYCQHSGLKQHGPLVTCPFIYQLYWKERSLYYYWLVAEYYAV